MSAPKPSLAKRFISELLGTFMLVFLGTLAMSMNLPVLNVGLAFGVAAIGAVYAFGHISGAHINPAVTFGLAVRGRFSWREVIPYVVAQLIGAVIAALLNASIVGEARALARSLGTTYPNVTFLRDSFILEPAVSALITEAVITFILVLTVLGATDIESPSGFAGLAIGLILGMNVMITATITGGSMNPARTFGPALALVLIGVSPTIAFNYHWIYWLGPLLGGFLAALVHWGKS